LAKTEKDRGEMAKKMASLGKELTVHLDHYSRTMPGDDAGTIRSIRGAQQRWLELNEKVRAATAQGQDAALAMAKKHSADPVPWEPAIGGLVKLSEKRLTEQVDNTHVIYARAKSTLLWVSIVAGVFAVGLGSLIFRGIRRNMDEVVELNTNLEGLVAARTQALAERERSLRLVLDSTGDALIGVELNGALNGECSAAAVAWFGEPRAGAPAGDYLFPGDADRSLSFGLGLEQLNDGFLPWEVAVDQLQKRITAGVRTLELEYKPVQEGGELRRFLLIARDITARIQHEASERSAREQQEMIAKLIADKRGFEQFVKDCEQLISDLSSERELSVTKRALHTLKGNAAIFGLASVSELCHAIEDRVAESEEPPTASDVASLASLFRARLQSIETFLSGVGRNVLELRADEHEALVASLLKRHDYDEILRSVELWSWSRTSERLAHLRAQAEYVAKRLEKDVAVSVEHNNLRLPPDYLNEVWSAATHAIRNAVDHGIEPAELREQRGKPRQGRITLATRETSDALVLVIEDDGGGVDWDALAEAARQRGLSGVPRERLLFLDGLSSRAEVTELSGRGVGLAALLQACEAEGGAIDVKSTPGVGTTFTMSFRRPVVKLGALAAELERRWSFLPRAGSAESSATLRVAGVEKVV
jgi:two-component system chemotaxis sensor kinase CheA